MKFNNAVVVVTGGASGIGRLMGKMALEKGASHVAVWDINETNLKDTIDEFSKIGKTSGHIVDVSNPEAIDRGYAETLELCGKVDILINNAGIITNNRYFSEQTDKDITLTMTINSVAPMMVARRILPDMIKRNHGHICNIASAAGLLAMPKMSVYVASKWAAYGWSESMRLELEEIKSNVHVTTAAPYFINTGMFGGIRPKVFRIQDPEKTAKKIIRAIEIDKQTRGIPFPVHFIRFNQAIFPSAAFDWLFGKVFGLYEVMDHFVGRKKAN